MNPRALLKSLLIVVILLGVAWLWWQSTTPDLSVEPAASASPLAKPAIAFVNFRVPQIPQAVMTAPAAKANDSVTQAATEPSEADARTAKARATLEGVLANAKEVLGENRPSSNPDNIVAGIRNTNYALTHQDPSVPDSAYLTVSLDQAEHHTFNFLLGTTATASIEGYYYDNGGREWVELYTWQQTLPSGGIALGNPSEQRRPITAFTPADQDYIRNWAKQQAAAAAATASSAPQAASDAEPPASAPTAQVQQGRLVITN